LQCVTICDTSDFTKNGKKPSYSVLVSGIREFDFCKLLHIKKSNILHHFMRFSFSLIYSIIVILGFSMCNNLLRYRFHWNSIKNPSVSKIWSLASVTNCHTSKNKIFSNSMRLILVYFPALMECHLKIMLKHDFQLAQIITLGKHEN